MNLKLREKVMWFNISGMLFKNRKVITEATLRLKSVLTRTV